MYYREAKVKGFSGRNSMVLLSSHTAAPLIDGEKSNNVFSIGLPISTGPSTSLVSKIRIVDSLEIIPDVNALIYELKAAFSLLSEEDGLLLYSISKIRTAATMATMNNNSRFDI